MKLAPLFLALIFVTVGADAQVRGGGGIFGFGKKTDQISSGLFPDNNEPVQSIQTSSPVVSSPAPRSERAPAPPRTSDNIFKNGSPQEVEAVSYVIENGEKVEKEITEKRKPRRFGFGKKEKNTEVADSDVLEPVPAPNYPDPRNSATEAPTFTPPSTPAVQPAPKPPAPVVKRTPKPETPEFKLSSEPIVSEPVVASVPEEKPKKGKRFSFFSRKKEEKSAPQLSESPLIPSVVESTTSTAAMETPRVAEVSKPAPVTPAPITQEPPATPSTSQPTFPVQPPNGDPIPSIPSFAGVEQPAREKKMKEPFSLTRPIANLRSSKPDKPVDLTGAETIISDGEIVAQRGDIVENNMVSSGDGTREPPRIINGVKTYSSWEDVEARSVSAADKILNQIR